MIAVKGGCLSYKRSESWVAVNLTYDKPGWITQIADASGATTKSSYDGHGKLINLVAADKGAAAPAVAGTPAKSMTLISARGGVRIALSFDLPGSRQGAFRVEVLDMAALGSRRRIDRAID